jgi:large subunit ribosomal protein L6
MSRIGSLKIDIKALQECIISEDKREIVCKNNKNSFTISVPQFLLVKIEEDKIIVEFDESYFPTARLKRINYPMWGTFVRTLQTKIIGLLQGHMRRLVVTGTGYRVEQKGEILVFKLGFSHSKEIKIPEGITVEMKTLQSATELILKSHDKCLLGDYAYSVCALRKPNGYSDKGIRDLEKVLIVKEVKKK